MQGVDVTKSNVPNVFMRNSLVFDAAVPAVDNVVADGEYYSLDRVEGLKNNRIILVVVASCTLVLRVKANLSCLDEWFCILQFLLVSKVLIIWLFQLLKIRSALLFPIMASLPFYKGFEQALV